MVQPTDPVKRSDGSDNDGHNGDEEPGEGQHGHGILACGTGDLK
jgi:hypothetical protein